MGGGPASERREERYAELRDSSPPADNDAEAVLRGFDSWGTSTCLSGRPPLQTDLGPLQYSGPQFKHWRLLKHESMLKRRGNLPNPELNSPCCPYFLGVVLTSARGAVLPFGPLVTPFARRPGPLGPWARTRGSEAPPVEDEPVTGISTRLMSGAPEEELQARGGPGRAYRGSLGWLVASFVSLFRCLPAFLFFYKKIGYLAG